MASRPKQRSRRLLLETCEDRIVFDVTPLPPGDPPPPGPEVTPPPVTPPEGSPPLAVNDDALIQILLPSTPVDVLGNDLDGNPGATWDFASLTVVTPPQFGTLTLDAASGQFLYTPNVFNPPPPPGSPPPTVQQDSFIYHVSNSLAMQSNDASVTLIPIGSPKEGVIVSFPDLGFTQSMQPVVINLLANDEIHFTQRQIDPASVGFSEFAVSPVGRLPSHGTVTFDPTTGAATYTPDFGYVGWDSFSYQVSTTAGAPDDEFPGEIFKSDDAVFVIIGEQPPRLQADPQDGQMLVVDGTQGNDTIRILPGDRWGEVKAIVNGVCSPSFRPTSRIVVFGYAGDDTITVDPRVTYKTWLIGGLGNDTLKAGGGPALLMGNEGNDTLFGGYQRDILIGGDGEDSLAGSYSADLLVGGSTRFDSQPAALGDMFSQWLWAQKWSHHSRPSWCAPSDGRPVRRDILKDTDVLDDGKKDILNGGPGKDLIIGSTTPPADEIIEKPAAHRPRKHSASRH